MGDALPPAPDQPEAKPLQPPKLRRNFILAAVIVLALGGSAAAFMLSRSNSSEVREPQNQTPSTTEEDQFAREYLRGCKNRAVSFTHPPVPLDQLGYIEPMGKVSDGHVTPTDHVYVAPKSMNAADNTTDVLMPADGTVIGVGAMPAQYIGDRQQQTAPEDHRLIVAHNCQYVSIFIHVHQLSDSLKAAVGTLQPNTQKQVSVELKAGDKLGRIGGNPVDWSLMDAKTKLSGFITPKLYEREPWKIHVVDPLSVYQGDLKKRLIELSLRTSEPYGGKIDYDRKGALVGNWFREGTNGYSGSDNSRYWDGHLSIAPNYIDPAGIVASLGNWQGKATQLGIKGGSADPSTLTASSGIVKYELIDLGYTLTNGQPWSGGSMVRGMKMIQSGPVRGVMLVQVLEGEKLKVELFPGKVATDVSGFTGAAQNYGR